MGGDIESGAAGRFYTTTTATRAATNLFSHSLPPSRLYYTEHNHFNDISPLVGEDDNEWTRIPAMTPQAQAPSCRKWRTAMQRRIKTPQTREIPADTSCFGTLFFLSKLLHTTYIGFFRRKGTGRLLSLHRDLNGLHSAHALNTELGVTYHQDLGMIGIPRGWAANLLFEQR